jgi:hypothetical protein
MKQLDLKVFLDPAAFPHQSFYPAHYLDYLPGRA